jgi:hypothetical protein
VVRPGPDPVRRRHLDREAIFVTGPVDPDLVAYHEHGQKAEQTGPLADETQAPTPFFPHRSAPFTRQRQTIALTRS